MSIALRSFFVRLPLFSAAQRIAPLVLRVLATVIVPTTFVLISAVALLLWGNEYRRDDPAPLSFQIEPSVKSRTAADLTGSGPTQLVGSFNSGRAETPFTLRFSLPRTTSPATVLEIKDRHIVTMQCWDRANGRELGSVDEGNSVGALRRAKAGLALFPGPGDTAIAVECQVRFSGPAHLTLWRWSARDFRVTLNEFERDSGLLDGGLGVLAAFILLTAIINRRVLYVVFAAWLMANMRMAAISAGWDFQWLNRTVPWEWLIPLRMWAAAAYYVLTTALFGLLFAEGLRRVGYRWLWRLNQLSTLVVVIGCGVLSFSAWLPFLWAMTAFTVAVITFFLARILIATRSRVALWYGLSLALTLFASLNEVIAAALGFRGLIGGINFVTAALGSSVLAALAIAEQMRQEHHERIRAQSALDLAYQASPIGLFSLSPAGHFMRANAVLVDMLGREVVDTEWSAHFGSDSWNALSEGIRVGAIEREVQRTGARDGRWYLLKAMRVGTTIEGSLQDITERMAASERMRFLANHDPLTGILNRRGLEQALSEALMRGEGTTSIAYLDLDRFKLINDLFGHPSGDHILCQVCNRIREQLGPQDAFGRVGGDEFVIAFPGTPPEEATARCRDIVQAVGAEPYNMEERAVHVKASVGLLHVPGSVDLKEALSLADRACREAKHARQAGGLVVYREGSAALSERTEELHLMQSFPQTGVPAGLFLVMQPIMSLRSPDSSLEFEVLLRRRTPEGHIVPPTLVINAAEASGKMANIDRWVLSEVLAWTHRNRHELQNTRFICVNLSGASLNDENFVREVFALLAQNREAAQRLCLEITEAVALQDLQNTRRFIERVRLLGAKVALDDFGAGYTSFSYLRELPADALKIDGAFVRTMCKQPANQAIVKAILELARNLGMKTIAEWVEDLPTLEALVAAGADYAQGFATGRPMDPQKILLAGSAAELVEDPATAAYVRAALCRPVSDSSLALAPPPFLH